MVTVHQLYQKSAVSVLANLANSGSPLRNFAEGNGTRRLDGRLAYTALYAAKHTDAQVASFYQFTKSLFGV